MMKGLEKRHDILLYLLDELPEKEAMNLQAELVSLFSTLTGQLEMLTLTQNLYEAVAGKIRAKASLHKRQQPMRADIKDFAVGKE